MTRIIRLESLVLSRCTLSSEVRRGMPILNTQGIEVGKVAAVVIDDENQSPVYLLLDHLPEQQGY